MQRSNVRVLLLSFLALTLVAGTLQSVEARSAKKRTKAAHPAKGIGIPVPDDSGAAYQDSGTIKVSINALGQTVYTVSASSFDISPPLSEMVASYTPMKGAEENEPSSNPLLPPWRIGRSAFPDPVVQPVPTGEERLVGGGFTPAAPSTGFNFAGVGISGGSPSDSNGSVGNSQFVEIVNTRYQVWSLNYSTHVATSSLGPSNINTVWSGFSNTACANQNSGDPIILYDKIANRWLISQFTTTAVSNNYYQCVAVSTTASATGTWARFAFTVPNNLFGDYPKISVWTDAYYMMAHGFQGTAGSYVAGIFAAMDRTKMLAGDSSATWQVILDANEGGHMPVDLDGYTPPPAGAPGMFLSNHSSGMYVYRMKVDFVTPANTTRTLQATVPTASWTAACGGGTCIPQPGTTALLDSLADRLMFRAAYRNFVDHESVTVSHSVDPAVTGLVSGVRWYDIRLSGTPDATCPSYPCMHQQGTIADVANGRSRWMPSMAMDGAENIIVGYSATGQTNGSDNQSIRYTGRAKTDSLGTMTAAEQTIATGTKNNTGNTRWGDYSSMSIDPFDDCTFWYVSQYIPTTASNWGTKIASVSFPAGSGAGQCQSSTCTSRPASAPTIGTASASSPNQITVSWTGIAPQPGSYAIERAMGACGSEGLYQPLSFTAGANGSFNDTTVQGGVTYSYKIVAATDAAGKCQALSTSGCASATATGNCNLKPSFSGAAAGTSANTSTCGIVVSWPTGASSCPLAQTIKYNVYRGTTPDFVPAAANRIATCVPGPSSYTDTGASSGVTYYYAVRSEDNTTANGGPCNGGNEDTNAIVVSGTAFGSGTQATASTWTDGGGDGTAFLVMNATDLGNTSDKAWRFVSTSTDAGANHTTGGAYAYRNAGPLAASTYQSAVCADIRTPELTVGSTTANLQYWERHDLEYHWDGVAVEYSQNGGEWNDVPTPSNSTSVGCATTDTVTGWETLSCTGTTPVNQCGYAATKNVFDGPLGSGTSCTDWATSTTPTSYAHRCHRITGLNPGDTIKFRWRFTSDSSAVYAGFYLDDVAVTNIRQPNACTADPCSGQANGTACNDGNACTQTDTCQNGVCVGSNPVTCLASDQCHTAGTCNTSTGVCSNPTAPNGTTCSDGNACTQTDTCQNGVCVGSNPVTCTASDQCHTAGTCNTSTGVCSNPTAPNGTTCNDGNACTQTDTCQSGTCTGSNPVTCTASDQCHSAGTCNTSTGVCSNPSAPNGTACNDGNGCTQTDTCQSGVCTGSNPVTCTASDQCHTAGTCNTSTGVCSNPSAPNGTACNDGNACTQTDTCQSGTCSGSNPVSCTASDQCHTAGTCNPATGVCSNPSAPNGTACNDDNACTQTDTCQSGTCTGTNPVTCSASDQCHTAGTCNTSTGVCSNPSAPNGTSCNDGNACTTGDACSGGSCVGGPAPSCNDNNPCTDDSCNPTTGCVHTNNTASCDDGNACTVGDACQQGVCNPGTGTLDCNDGNVCTDDACNPATGCVHTNNTASCDDGNACTTGDTCAGGSCQPGAGALNCNDNNPCTDDSCSPATGCVHTNNTAPCDDGDACTTGDTCGGGTCHPGAGLDCNDNNPCTDDSCDVQAQQCIHTNNTASCSDGNACTVGDVCGGGTCHPGTGTLDCNDDNVCTDDSCNPATGCQHANNTASCSDGNACTVGDVCGGGSCQPGTGTLDCNDNNVCTNDSCVPATGCQHVNNTAPCDDGNACTVGDACGGGTCHAGAPLVCNDNNVCTDDGCNPAAGCVFTANTAACDDGNDCTAGDSCSGGVCVSGSPVPPPGEAHDVVANDKTTYTWSPVPGATRYDVLRGSTGAFPVGPGGADEVCFDNLATPALGDPGLPAVGNGYWYLSRGENACGDGTYGTQSNGSERTSTTCP